MYHNICVCISKMAAPFTALNPSSWTHTIQPFTHVRIQGAPLLHFPRVTVARAIQPGAHPGAPRTLTVSVHDNAEFVDWLEALDLFALQYVSDHVDELFDAHRSKQELRNFQTPVLSLNRTVHIKVDAAADVKVQPGIGLEPFVQIAGIWVTGHRFGYTLVLKPDANAACDSLPVPDL
jgi:hypothetical protein